METGINDMVSLPMLTRRSQKLFLDQKIEGKQYGSTIVFLKGYLKRYLLARLPVRFLRGSFKIFYE